LKNLWFIVRKHRFSHTLLHSTYSTSFRWHMAFFYAGVKETSLFFSLYLLNIEKLSVVIIQINCILYAPFSLLLFLWWVTALPFCSFNCAFFILHSQHLLLNFFTLLKLPLKVPFLFGFNRGRQICCSCVRIKCWEQQV